jgi:7,8-dihydro-6-hydroxymethylpterin dimethyltransferase
MLKWEATDRGTRQDAMIGYRTSIKLGYPTFGVVIESGLRDNRNPVIARGETELRPFQNRGIPPMSILHASSKVAGIAWNAAQLINRSLPEGQLPTPVWSQTPLSKMKERAAPPLGPRITQSVCPKCLIEVRDGVLAGTVNATDLTDRPGVIDAEIVEEAGTVLLRKSCDRHGPFEDTLATDSEFFWKMESLFPGYDFERTEAPVHGVHSVRYGRGSYVLVDLTTRCNMKCNPCFMDANQLDHVYELSLDEIKSLLDQAASVEPKREFNILFSGGEPTLSPHFLEAVSYARTIGLNRLHVATNGIRFAESPDFARAAHAAGLHGVFLQIDGMTEEKNAHRGIGNYLDIKLKAIDNISTAGMRVTLQVTVINTVNNDAVGSIVQFAAENSEKIFGVLFQPIMFAGRDEKIDDESRYRERYTLSQLASDLKAQSTVRWEPLRDWWPMACYSTFCMFVDMIHPERERGSTFVNAHPDSAVFSPLIVNRMTGEWYPIAAFFNVGRFLDDVNSIIDSARGPLLSKAQMALAILRNFDASKAPRDLQIEHLTALFRQCMLRATSQSENWSSDLYDRQSWTILIIGGFWWQDLFNYELHNIQMSTAVVADAGLDPARVQNAEVSFSFKNAGGWRQVGEWARRAPTLSQWHSQHGRHRIYANGQFVPIEQIRPYQRPLTPFVLAPSAANQEVSVNVLE